jgi:hypothetical protein
MTGTDEINASYEKLKDYLQKHDPIKLLSQMALTFLVAPADQRPDSKPDAIDWMRWMEFLTELALSREYPSDAETFIDGRNMEEMEKLVRGYFDAVRRTLVMPQPSKVSDPREAIVAQARAYSFFVRGVAYPQQLLETAESLYSNYDDWFRNHLHFRVGDAIKIFKSLETGLNRRLDDERRQAREAAEQATEGLTGQERDSAMVQVAWPRFYGRSDELLSFTPEEIATSSGCPLEVCVAFLDRMSQHFGYLNPLFPHAFQDALLAPWDYRSLYERPIIAHGGKYYVLTLFLFPEAICQTFYYDLIGDACYWNHGGQDIYGRWLEATTADCLKRVFPSDEVLLNPSYSPTGREQRELCDVLVLHDRKVLVFQCKTKKMRFESLMGMKYEAIREDLEKSVKDSFEQAVIAYKYLKECYDSKHDLLLTVSGRQLRVDVTQIVDPASDVFLVSLVLENYQNFITRLANTNDSLALFPADSYPWAISLADLDILTDLLDSPATFLHYAKRRSLVERTASIVLGDELDMLGYYFRQGLYFNTDEFKNLGFVGLTGMSEDIDQYMFEKYAAVTPPSKPRQYAPEGFWEYIRAIDGMTTAYAVDCAMYLLDLDGPSRRSFVELVSAAKAKTATDGHIHSYSAGGAGSAGWCFVAMDAGCDDQQLFDVLMPFMQLKKYVTRSRTWFGFGWDMGSDKVLDMALFLSSEWQEDTKMASMAREAHMGQDSISAREPDDRGTRKT